MPLAEIHHRQKLHAELVLHLLLERVHQRVVEDGDLMRRALVDIARREDRELRKEGRELLRGGDRHLEIARVDRLELGPLLDEDAL
jgi:hypothetical protein